MGVFETASSGRFCGCFWYDGRLECLACGRVLEQRERFALIFLRRTAAGG
jgi:hypothetical protein